MKKRMQAIFMSLLGVILLAGCFSGAVPTLEITRLAPQTVEVTRLVPQTVVITRTPQPTAIPYALDTGYYEGVVVITQYYTFLGHGLYEEAYQLLSSSFQRPQSLEDYVSMAKSSIEIIEIVTIMPYYADVTQQGGHAQPDPEGERRFVAKVKVWGEGGAVNGSLRLFFLALVRENDEWKIDKSYTAPFVSYP